MNDRARVQVTDVIVVAAVSIVSYGMAPVYYDMISRVEPFADPLSQLLLQLIVPFIFMGIVLSVGVSARRAD